MEADIDENKEILRADKLIRAVEQLRFRISERFPNSGLSKVCGTLLDVARVTDMRIAWIERPHWGYRLLVGIVLIVTISALIYAVGNVEVSSDGFGLTDLVQVAESALNNVIIIGAAIIFLVSIEARAKRKKVVRSVNRLRSIAHVIDAHQLTKDPNVAVDGSGNTLHSPKRTLTPYQLNRYLDYCSELLSLVGKISFLYVQNFNDPVAVKSVNDLETLTTSLARKVWQKIMIIRSQNQS